MTPDERLDFGAGITANDRAMFFDPGVDIEVWRHLGTKLRLHDRAMPWWIGDWIEFGDHSYPEASQEFDTEDVQYSYGTLRNYASVAATFAPCPEGVSCIHDNCPRHWRLPWGFYESAASLPVEQQAELLSAAVQGREDEPDEWKLVSFRARVRHAKSGYQPDRKGYTDEEPTSEEHTRLASGDRCDVAILEESPWPDGEVDLLLTSPPYGVGISYADGGDVDRYEDYLELVALWASAICRLLNPRHGRAVINVPLDRSDNAGRRGRPSYRGRPIGADWTTALIDAGLEYRSTLLWIDNDAGEGTTRGSVDSPSAPHIVAPAEVLICVYRGSWSRSTERAHDLSHEEWLELGPRGVWTFNGTSDHSNHPAPWPEELPGRVIRTFSFRGDLIADPFAGQGTAGVVGARLGRRVWLADRSEQYIGIARQALIEARRGTQEVAA